MKIFIIGLVLLNIIGKIYLHYLDYKINKDIKIINSLTDKNKIQS